MTYIEYIRFMSDSKVAELLSSLVNTGIEMSAEEMLNFLYMECLR